MKRTLLATSVLVFLLTGCGGGAEIEPNDQPWLDGSTPPNGGTQTNLPPKLTGVPTGTVTLRVGQTHQIALAATDPENKSLTFSLSAGAPEWVTISQSGILTFKPIAIGSSTVVVQVSDGVNTTSSTPITISVQPPSELSYKPVPPIGAKDGDVIRLGFVKENGEATVFSTTLDGDKTPPILLPYPLGDAFKNGQAVLVWDASGRGLVPYRNWIGSISSLYEGLNASFELPLSRRQAHTPTPLSSAYLHGLNQRASSSHKGAPFTISASHQTIGAEQANTLLHLAALYDLSHKRSEVSALNLALRADYETPRHQTGLGSLPESVEKIRLSEDALLNARYWGDLINSSIASLSKPPIVWQPGRGQLLSPVDARFGSGFGQSLELHQDGTYRIAGQTLSWLSGRTGSWKQQGNDLVMTYQDPKSVAREVQITYDKDPVLLRESLMSVLGISFSDASNWAAQAKQKGMSQLNFTVHPADRLELRTTVDSISGERPVAMQTVGKVELTGGDGVFEYVDRHIDRVWRPIPNQFPTYFEYRNEVFDVVLPLPSDTTDAVVNESQMSWLNMYDAPLVRERVSSKGISVFEQTNDWSVQYNEVARQFVLTNPVHAAGSLRYTITLSGTPVLLPGELEIHNSRRYAAHAELTLDGKSLYDGPVSMSLVPKSRCEDKSRCQVDAVKQEYVVWKNSNWGMGGAGNDLLYIKQNLTDGKTDEYFQSVRLGASCIGTTIECFVPLSDPLKIAVESNGAQVRWRLQGGKQAVWHPMQVSKSSLTVLEEGGKQLHWDSTPFAPESLIWVCSMVNPSSIEIMNGNNQAARDNLILKCSP